MHTKQAPYTERWQQSPIDSKKVLGSRATVKMSRKNKNYNTLIINDLNSGKSGLKYTLFKEK